MGEGEGARARKRARASVRVGIRTTLGRRKGEYSCVEGDED